MAVACLPVVTLSFAAALVHLKRADAMGVTADDGDTPAVATADDAVDDGGGDGDGDGRAPSPVPPPRPSPSPPRNRQGKPSAKAARALAVIKRNPGLNDAQVAAKAGVSESTARRARNGTAKTPRRGG
jgi:hypothetical protein